MTWGISDDDIYINIERGIKRECMRGREFQAKVSRSKDLYPLGTEMHPSTRLARNLYKWGNHVFSCCFTVVVSF